MITAKEETAEQKLLKMIEANSAGQPAPAARGKPSWGTAGLMPAVRTAKRFSLAAAVFAVLFFIYEVKTGLDYASRDVTVETGVSTARSSGSAGVIFPVVQRLSYYLANVKQRDIFQPYETPRQAGGQSPESRHLAKTIEAYRLVGVAWFETVDTASVMIEDKKTNVTYFLKKGEKLGNINVKTIYADSALLGLENEEIIIRYDK
jgi:hypothetical protein